MKQVLSGRVSVFTEFVCIFVILKHSPGLEPLRPTHKDQSAEFPCPWDMEWVWHDIWESTLVSMGSCHQGPPRAHTERNFSVFTICSFLFISSTHPFCLLSEWTITRSVPAGRETWLHLLKEGNLISSVGPLWLQEQLGPHWPFAFTLILGPSLQIRDNSTTKEKHPVAGMMGTEAKYYQEQVQIHSWAWVRAKGKWSSLPEESLSRARPWRIWVLAH